MPDTDEEIYGKYYNNESGNNFEQKHSMDTNSEKGKYQPEISLEEYERQMKEINKQKNRQKYKQKKLNQQKFAIENKRATCSMAKQTENKVNLINDASIRSLPMKFIKSTLISGMKKTMLSIQLTQDEQ